MTPRHLLAAGTATAALLGATPALAACDDLMKLQLEDGTVTSAQVVEAGAFQQPGPAGAAPGVAPPSYSDTPAFCRVQVTLSPSEDSDIKSEIWLPLDGWNGKYVGIGNGIWAGSISYSSMSDPVKRGYATASTDTGHSGNGLTAEWAIGHPEKLVDFGHRAVHVTTQAAKAAIRAFYGKGPSLSLWNSCSTGGRQGLMAAHRYPEDFDAISSMAPANPMTDLMVQSMWAGWQPKRFDTSLTPQKLGLVHAAALKRCDAQDGLEDALISRPDTCDFDPGALRCEPGQTEGCLSDNDVLAMRGLYGGVRAADGSQLLPGWPIGSEMQMAVLVMGQEPFPVATSYFRDLVYAGRSGWDWSAAEYRGQLADARSFGADILNVPTDGLGPFFARGGKLLLSHGWNDGLIPATNTLAFHHGLYNALPLAQAQTQLRLFMAPGMDHCAGGEGPSEFDTLGVLDAWASTGMAPNRIIATRPTTMPTFPGQPPMPDRDPMDRPLCPYPLVAKYDGTGDPGFAESFACGEP